jgi:hypothetical protein
MLSHAEVLKVNFVQHKTKVWSIPLAAPSKSQVCGQLLAWIVGLNRAGCMGESLSRLSLLCCQVEVSAAGRFLVQKSSIDCGVSVCDLRTSTVMRLRHEFGCCATGRYRVSWVSSLVDLFPLFKNGENDSLLSLLLYVFIIPNGPIDRRKYHHL